MGLAARGGYALAPNRRQRVTYPILEHTTKNSRHTSFYLSCGAPSATPIIFLHGWPELSISWRHQLPVFAALGFRAIAPDMRGYGRSTVYTRHEDYAQEHIVADMIDLLDALGREAAIWVGHDWGSPVVWGIAQNHPQRCHAVASLCVPYLPNGFTPDNAIALSDRTLYPADKFPAAQWDYQLFYQESFAAAVAAFEANVRATVKLLFRAGDAAGKGQPAITAFIRANQGFFGPTGSAPDVPRDPAVLTEEDEHRYTAALERNGFFGPDSWYMNAKANAAFAERAQGGWRLSMPTLFMHAAYDYICETIDSPAAGPMRAHCDNLTETTVQSGHWMAQEKPLEVSAALAKWLSVQLPHLWPST
jgi:pimeloyl-ACP methyl ester carboxylesterase